MLNLILKFKAYWLNNQKKELKYPVEDGKQIYFVQIEGTSFINGVELNHGDAMEITDEKFLHVKALKKAHCLFISMNKE